jgi:hypothetical protein
MNVHITVTEDIWFMAEKIQLFFWKSPHPTAGVPVDFGGRGILLVLLVVQV